MSRIANRIGVSALFGYSIATIACSASQSTLSTGLGIRRSVVATNANIVVDERPLDAMELVKKESDSASRLGASAVQILAIDAGTEGDRIGAFVSVNKDSCILAYARGTSDISDLDLIAFDDAGTTLAADQASDPKPSIVVCPPHPARIYLAARIASGHGIATVAVHAVPKEVGARVALAFGARTGAQGETQSPQQWAGLDARIAERRAALGGHWEDVRKASVQVSPRTPTYLTALLPASTCLDVLAVPSEDTALLDVTLTDDSGREVARADNVGRERTALLCSPTDTTITVALRPHDGNGTTAIVLSRSRPGDEVDLAARADARRTGAMLSLDRLRARLGDELSKAGYDSAKELGAGQIDPSKSASIAIELSPGCSRIDVIAGAPVAGISARLWNNADELIARHEGGEHSSLFACVSAPTKASLELNSVGRPGSFVAELRKEKQQPADLVRSPLAASRFMGRANAALQIVQPNDLHDLQLLDLDGAKRASATITIPSGKCSTIVGASSNGVTGLTLRAVDITSSEASLDSANGTQSAALRVCAPSQSRRVRVALESRAGKGQALLGWFDSGH